MRFSNAKEMYEYLNSGHDLYHPESGIYVFSFTMIVVLYVNTVYQKIR